jgi:hypothetical protein
MSTSNKYVSSRPVKNYLYVWAFQEAITFPILELFQMFLAQITARDVLY